MSIYAGLDVSDETTSVCVVEGEGIPLLKSDREIWRRAYQRLGNRTNGRASGRNLTIYPFLRASDPAL